MRVDLDVIAVGRDRSSRAHVDALIAADFAGTAVRAYLLVISEEPRFLELADHLRKLCRRERLLKRVAARSQVALGSLRGLDRRLARQVEHHVEALASRAFDALEVYGADRAAGFHALAVRPALVHVDLVREVDRLFRAGVDAGVAARADLQIDRVVLLPGDFERAEIAFDRLHFSGPHRVAPLDGQLSAAPRSEQYVDVELLGELLGPGNRRVGRPDDQQLAARLVRDAGDWFSLGQIGKRKHRRDLGGRLRAFLRPARVLADVDELDVRGGARLIRQLREQRRFLRARDHAGFVLQRSVEARDLFAAQLSVDFNRLLALERRCERLSVQRHGLVAVAELERLVVKALASALKRK